ncbi:MAG: LysR family transcriptional regulator [Myxococcota bacterium]
MDWDDLEIVLAVHRGGSLVRAAEALNVAHTTVGRRLARVEERLGVRLFDRTPTGLVATPSGEDVAMTAERVEEEVQGMQSRVLGRDAHLSGPLHVSTVDVILACFGDALGAFVSRYPDVDLTLSLSREPVSLARREADVALRASNEPPDTLVGRRLGGMQFGVYAARSLVARVGEGAPLSAYPWIGWGGGPNVAWFQRWLAENAPGARRVLRLDDRGVMMAHAVRAGIGAQLLPCVLADGDDALVRIAPLDPLFQLGLWVLIVPELRTNRRVRAFMAHMADALRSQRARLEGRTDAAGALSP